MSMHSQAAMKGRTVVMMIVRMVLLVSIGMTASGRNHRQLLGACSANNVCSNRNVPDGCPCINGCSNCIPGAYCGVHCLGGAVSGNVCVCGRSGGVTLPDCPFLCLSSGPPWLSHFCFSTKACWFCLNVPLSCIEYPPDSASPSPRSTSPPADESPAISPAASPGTCKG